MNCNTVLDWLEQWDSDKVVYSDEKESITFQQVKEQAQRIGSSLKEVQGTQPVAILSGRHVHTIVGYLGIVYSGHAYAPIDGSLPKERIEVILQDLDPACILADDSYMELAKSLAHCEVYSLEECLAHETDTEYLACTRRNLSKTDPLYVIFTSGSSGKPKGVITDHLALMTYIESYVKVMKIDKEDVLGNQSPLDYIAAIRDIYIPLLTGCSSFILKKEYFMEPDRLFDVMNTQGITSVGWSVSAFTILTSLGAFEDNALKTLKKICFSGSIMPSRCLRVWQTHLPEAVFVNQYGPTEATASCTYYVVDHVVEENEVLPIGVPYENYHVFLVKEDLSYAEKGETGEICVSGPILALGYYNDPERTSKSFVLNPNCKGYPQRMYRTGDYGQWNEDGLLMFHGRMDRQIKHMGHRVELDEIEVAARRVDGVQECVAMYNKEKEVLYLFYEGTCERRQLILGLRSVLPGFMVPRKVLQLEKLPRLANGKLDTTTLKENM